MIRESQQALEIHCSLPSPVHEKVLIMGAPATTTLGSLYDAPVSLEYAREYQIQEQWLRDDELTPKVTITYSWDSMIKPLSSSIVGNRGLVIADTNSWWPRVITTTIWSRRPRPAWPVPSTTSLSLFSQENGIWSSLYSRRALMSMMVSRYDRMADEEIRTSFQITY